MIRNLVSNFTKSIIRRVVAPRYNHRIPMRISFAPGKTTGKLEFPLPNQTLSGETKDLSKSGIAFIVCSIRLKESYLVGEERPLVAELDLPGGTIKMEVIGRRYEQLIDEHSSASCYMIGASISHISDADREIYEHFMRFGKKLMKADAATAAVSLELGVDKG